MSNRLQLFRKRMAAFEGTADPLEAINSGYYVHAPAKLLVDEISGRIALRPFSSHLLIGGIGSELQLTKHANLLRLLDLILKSDL